MNLSKDNPALIALNLLRDAYEGYATVDEDSFLRLAEILEEPQDDPDS